MLKKSFYSRNQLIKDYAVWNGFPKRIANSIIKQALQTNDSNTTRSKNGATYEHLSTCSHYSLILDLFNVNNHDVKFNKFNINQIRSNTIVLDKAYNWYELLFKEALLIKSHKPLLNTGLKASKELQLF